MYYFGTDNHRKGDYWYDRGDYVKALEYYNAALDTLRRNINNRSTTIYYPLAYVLLEIAITYSVRIGTINPQNPISESVKIMEREFKSNFSEAKTIYTHTLTGEEKDLISTRLKLSQVVYLDHMTTLYWNRADYLSRIRKEEATEQHEVLENALTHLQKAREYANQLNKLNDKQRDSNLFDDFEADINLGLSKACISIVNDKDCKLDTYYLIGFLKSAADYNREAFALIDNKCGNKKLLEVHKQYLKINEQLFNLTDDETYGYLIKNYASRYNLSTNSLLNTLGTFRRIPDTANKVQEYESDDSMNLVN
ncbi:MAG: hypothetical protein WC627_00645 [Legionella sp.]|jgi:tetratricopeptide (TPR) repeat protein